MSSMSRIRIAARMFSSRRSWKIEKSRWMPMKPMSSVRVSAASAPGSNANRPSSAIASVQTGARISKRRGLSMPPESRYGSLVPMTAVAASRTSSASGPTTSSASVFSTVNNGMPSLEKYATRSISG